MKNASYCVSYGKEGRLQQNEQKNSFCYSPFSVGAPRGAPAHANCSRNSYIYLAGSPRASPYEPAAS